MSFHFAVIRNDLATVYTATDRLLSDGSLTDKLLRCGPDAWLTFTGLHQFGTAYAAWTRSESRDFTSDDFLRQSQRFCRRLWSDLQAQIEGELPEGWQNVHMSIIGNQGGPFILAINRDDTDDFSHTLMREGFCCSNLEDPGLQIVLRTVAPVIQRRYSRREAFETDIRNASRRLFKELSAIEPVSAEYDARSAHDSRRDTNSVF